MTRKFKRGYVEKGWRNDWSITITKVIQTNDYGKWEDEDEEEINSFCGYKTEEEAIEDLKTYYKVKEILDEDYKVVWNKLK